LNATAQLPLLAQWNSHTIVLINFYENEIKYIIVKENSVINITHNEAQALFAIKPTIERHLAFSK